MLEVAKANKVLVELPPPPSMEGRFFIPAPNVYRPSDGRVISVGDDVIDINVGDRVFFQWQHGGADRFERDGKDYLLLNAKQILAVIE